MTVKECIKEGLIYLGLEDLIEKMDLEDYDTQAMMLLTIAKNVIEEIVCDYYPLKNTQTVVFSEGKAFLKALNLPIDIYAVRQNDVNVDFSVLYDRIEAQIEGSAQVIYSQGIRVNSFDLELPFNQKIGTRVIGYGIACEYCVINGMKEAAVFDKKYRDGLKKALSKKKSDRQIRGRQWA